MNPTRRTRSNAEPAEPSRPRQVLLVGEPSLGQAGLAELLRQDGLHVTTLAPGEVEGAAGAALRADTVALVGFETDAARTLATVTELRRLAPRVPVVAVAVNPSPDFVRRVRLSGIFYLALEPVNPAELRSILRDAFEATAARREEPSASKVRPKVLVVDDDTDFVASTSALLEGQGYQVCTAGNGREALGCLAAEQPDLVVLDVLMENDWAGYTVAQAIKSAGEGARHLPVLMVSSVPLDPTARFAGAAEAEMVAPDRYLTKPLDIPKFLETVGALLGRPAGADAGAAG